MEALRKLVAYNGWANGRVFEVCKALDSAALEQPAPGSIGSIAETLQHMIGVEDGYLAMLQKDAQAVFGARDAYMAQPFAWFANRQGELRRAYDELVQNESEIALMRPIKMPWFPGPMTARDGYLQVATHSAQHRAQAFSILGSRGVQVPDLDYAFMLFE